MQLIIGNLSFIQRAELDSSWKGLIKYEIGARISCLAITPVLLAEAIGRACLAILAQAVIFITLGYWEEPYSWVKLHSLEMQIGASVSLNCFLSVLSPKTFESRLIKILGRVIREHRIRFGDIPNKLSKELKHAQTQMGQQTPKTFKYLKGVRGEKELQNDVFGATAGICHDIGRRKEMEDEHLATHFNLQVNGTTYPVRLFGIFDGHGGNEASLLLKTRLQDRLEQMLTELNPNGLTDVGIWNALKLVFVELNQELDDDSGSTATVAMTIDGKLWTANLGDSRTILLNGKEIIQLTEDATPNDARYKKGIENRGGWIKYADNAYRVNARIACARALGDRDLKGAMSARPKITAIPLSEINPNSLLILACDGIYDVASTKQVGEAVRENRDLSPEVLAQNLVFSAYKARSRDNLSVMVVTNFVIDPT